MIDDTKLDIDMLEDKGILIEDVENLEYQLYFHYDRDAFCF